MASCSESWLSKRSAALLLRLHQQYNCLAQCAGHNATNEAVRWVLDEVDSLVASEVPQQGRRVLPSCCARLAQQLELRVP
eukprot:CAMPEP_0114617652 /NCGR_PEP_ID=MMETSP0168-20121206/7305_1 /TAXON_ID=95228 ORGANISM="Vannella sp., Strain DIVA3 517/6/12" /NCGR_SAMPLE_ID=MMETSP0168 /ASSEMBLY_ACC=CAM_ASM_000044 /LENGTH=79 /DNA_ID=CAMNT_0001828789 /DNA_START=340 /DNA_END=575 /DNA_ORIENTATION=-